MAEQWYAVIDSATGEALSFGTTLADPLPAGTEAVAIDHQPGAGERWDAGKRAIVKPTDAEIAAELEEQYNALGEQIATLRGIPITTLSVGEVGRRP